MDHVKLIAELLVMPGRIKEAEDRYREAIDKLNEAKLRLLEKECELYAAGKVKGKNETERQGQMWPYTKEIHKDILRAESKVDETKVEYNYLRQLNENLMLIAKLMPPA